jgi:hypothetical protein
MNKLRKILKSLPLSVSFSVLLISLIHLSPSLSFSLCSLW